MPSEIIGTSRHSFLLELWKCAVGDVSRDSRIRVVLSIPPCWRKTDRSRKNLYCAPGPDGASQCRLACRDFGTPLACCLESLPPQAALPARAEAKAATDRVFQLSCG
jgi:hypothetical protein